MESFKDAIAGAVIGVTLGIAWLAFLTAIVVVIKVC
jgi:hypothetical protein